MAGKVILIYENSNDLNFFELDSVEQIPDLNEVLSEELESINTDVEKAVSVSADEYQEDYDYIKEKLQYCHILPDDVREEIDFEVILSYKIEMTLKSKFNNQTSKYDAYYHYIKIK